MSPFILELSAHASDRIKQRRITRGQIRQALTKGTLLKLDIRGRRIKSFKIRNRSLEVIYLEIKGGYLIVTAYWRS